MPRKIVVKEVTQPVHGPDGHSLVHWPGQQFPQDHELPDGVPWRLAIADEPEPEPAAKTAPAAAASKKA